MSEKRVKKLAKRKIRVSKTRRSRLNRKLTKKRIILEYFISRLNLRKNFIW